MRISPIIVGRGRAGQAIARSFATLNLLNPELNLSPPVWLERGASLINERKRHEQAVLCIANPHGLHADLILEADAAGFAAILCEKPACVNLEQARKLREVKTPTAVLHVYRQMWGTQTLKKMLVDARFGDLVSIEGRYWQASTAERALTADAPSAVTTWKSNSSLSGKSDAYLDVGTHWLDAVSFLFGEAPQKISGWRSFVNAEAPHRDSHVQLNVGFPSGGRAFGSISKTFHGATNHFELNVIGSKKSATWEFLKPDELIIGEGRDRQVLTRRNCEYGSQQPPHHGMGWLEGHIEIIHCLVREITLKQKNEYPNLQENLKILEAMLQTDWLAI